MTRLALFILVAATACASAPAPKAAPARSRADAATATAAIPTEGLPPQSLKPGECGLFLWGQSTPRRFVFFSEASSGTALVLIDSKPEKIALEVSGGSVFGAFMTETTYLSEDGAHRVFLVVKPGEELEDGQRISSGRLVTIQADGWETVLPVAGLRACIPG